MWVTALGAALLLFSCSAQESQQRLKLIGKWTAINADPTKQVSVICEGENPTWLLSENQKNNERVQVNETQTGAILRVLPKLTPEDEATFTCGRKDSNQTLKFDLKLYNPTNDAVIRVTVPQEIASLHEYKDAQWLVFVESDSEFSIEPDFFVNSRHEIDCERIEATKHQCVMRLRNATEQDMNHYEFVAYNDRAKKSFKLIALVFPEIKYMIVSTLPPVYTPGLVTSPICMPDNVVASETGALIRKNGVKWEYVECEEPEKCMEGNVVPIESISNGTAEEDQGALTYTLKNFTPKKSGVLKCEGVDSRGFRTATTKTVCITDGPAVLTKNKTGKLEPGKKATVFCEFSKCNYDRSSGIRWFHTSKLLTEKVRPRHSALEEITESVKSGELGGVFRSRLNIDSLREGTYVCKAKAIGNYPEYEQFPVLSTKPAAS